MASLTDFHILRPPHNSSQADTLEWFVRAHEKVGGDVRERLARVGCKPGVIDNRGHVLEDYLHSNWEEMKVFRLHESPQGVGLSKRLEVYAHHADKILDQFYEGIETPPDEIFHVTCTGYLSPSCAQKLVSRKGWAIPVTHAYHMGCYGALSAIRQAVRCNTVDVVHTELCSLHLNPAIHSADQLVAQSLFSDGFIKYRVTKQPDGPHLKYVRGHEEIVPNSETAMTWTPGDYGFHLSLSKEIPVLIARSIKGYLQRLGADIGASIFAVHPGGPKILDHIQKVLDLRPEQLTHSRKVLKAYGNMSSATIPHIWDEILRDEKIPSQTPIVSLAFGPGLTITGTILEKVC